MTWGGEGGVGAGWRNKDSITRLSVIKISINISIIILYPVVTL